VYTSCVFRGALRFFNKTLLLIKKSNREVQGKVFNLTECHLSGFVNIKPENYCAATTKVGGLPPHHPWPNFIRHLVETDNEKHVNI
jgi:hypothetical protein